MGNLVVTRGKLEESKKWRLAVVVVAVVGMVVFAAVGYVLSREDDEEAQESTPISIVGSELATSSLVDHGSGTPSDPYVITELDVPIWGGYNVYGIVVSDVEDYLVLSGSLIHSTVDEYGPILKGIRLYNSSKVTILDCTFEDLSAGIEIESCENINISNNHFVDCFNGINFNLYHSDDVSIYDNSFDGGGYGVVASGWEDGIGCHQLSVIDNGFARGAHALWVDDSDVVTIANNVVGHTEGTVFYLSYCSEAAVEANTIWDANAAAFSLFEASKVAIRDNHVNAGNLGVVIVQSSSVNVSDNDIQTSTGMSIRNSISVDLYHNFVSEATTGVWIADSKWVNITYCDISTSFVGIQLLSSGNDTTGVIVHHNNFMDDDISAIDNSDVNKWDDGVGAGNFWNDYTGVDGNSDGIGDTPREIDDDSADRYPLMTPALLPGED